MNKAFCYTVALLFCYPVHAQDVLLDIAVAQAGSENVKKSHVEAIVGEETNVPTDGPFRLTVTPSILDEGYISLEFRRYDKGDPLADPLIGPIVLLVEGVEGGMTQTSESAQRDDISIAVTSHLR